jgi:hypothetical protein
MLDPERRQAQVFLAQVKESSLIARIGRILTLPAVKRRINETGIVPAPAPR